MKKRSRTDAAEWKNEASVAFVVKGPTVACKHELLAKHPICACVNFGVGHHVHV